ncbi:MAG: hypothetical protein DSY37_02935 [Hyperthermus sp.]|nr:MAG: hypothetical protein DSY37_02935 [Hyperthermus sp.]
MDGRSICIESTLITLLRPIYPRYTNRYGTLHGGMLAWWMLEAGSMSAMRASGGYVVLGAIDYLFMLNPGRLGENLHAYSLVIGATRHTLDVLTYAESAPPGGRETKPVSLSIQTFVSVDENVKPRPHGINIKPCSMESKALETLHLEWLAERKPLIEERKLIAQDTKPLETPYRVESYQVISPEAAFSLPNVLDASKLFYDIDQVAAIAAMKATGSPVVTASFDAAVFASPGYVGDLLRIEAGITGVGNTSSEVLVKITAENPEKDRKTTIARMYTIMVSIGPDGRPIPHRIKPKIPHTLQQAFEERQKTRRRRRARTQQLIRLVESIVKKLP